MLDVAGSADADAPDVLPPVDVSPAPAEAELLDGEDPSSADVQVAVHWISVYSDLLTVKLALLQRHGLQPEDAGDGASALVERDRFELEAEVSRCRRRLASWRQRVRQLIDENGSPCPL